jgi:hypothetical protein
MADTFSCYIYYYIITLLSSRDLVDRAGGSWPHSATDEMILLQLQAASGPIPWPAGNVTHDETQWSK